MMHLFRMLLAHLLTYRMGIRLDSKLGYLKVEAFCIDWMFVWGFHGNVYFRPVVRLDLICGITLFTIECVHRHRTTKVYCYRPWSWGWNSEHIAVWLGEYHENDYCPSYYHYRGLFGHHTWL